MSYESTTVDVAKSQSEIRKLLSNFGAAGFQFGEGSQPTGQKWAGVTFQHNGHVVMMQVPLKPPNDAEQKRQLGAARRARTRTLVQIQADYWEQEARRIWRVLYWSLKSRMVAVDEGVEEFEQAFLAHLVDPVTGGTLWQAIQPTVASGAFQVGGAGLRAIGTGHAEESQTSR